MVGTVLTTRIGERGPRSDPNDVILLYPCEPEPDTAGHRWSRHLLRPFPVMEKCSPRQATKTPSGGEVPKSKTWPELLTAADLCQRWGISRSTLGRWIRAGVIPGTRIPFPYTRIGPKLRLTAAQAEFVERHFIHESKHAGG
jgi:hypothetical protein